MAERPILKSEREATQAEAAQTPKRDIPKPVKKADRKDTGEAGGAGEQQDPTQGHWTDNMDGRGKGGRKGGKGKGRGKGRGDARKAPANPALMRGPRPTAKVEEPEPEETPAEEAPVEATEATAEVTTEETAAPAEETSGETAETPAAESAEESA